MKYGDIVEVYQKPFTKEKPEGKVKLIRRLIKPKLSEIYEYWTVDFLSDDARANRWIKSTEEGNKKKEKKT